MKNQNLFVTALAAILLINLSLFAFDRLTDRALLITVAATAGVVVVATLLGRKGFTRPAIFAVAAIVGVAAVDLLDAGALPVLRF